MSLFDNLKNIFQPSEKSNLSSFETITPENPCPYCNQPVGKRLFEGENCPKCDKYIYILNDKLLNEEMGITAWINYLKPLGVSRENFDEKRQELTNLGKRQATINDTLWGILNSSVTKNVGENKRLYFIYMQMAEIVASELGDPDTQLRLAERYAPNGFAMLERNPDPQNKMINMSNYAGGLEFSGKIDDAIEIYSFLLKKHFPHPGPYERLRILHSKSGNYKEAVKVCKAFIEVHKKVGYTDDANRFNDWITKYEKKIEEQKAKPSTRKKPKP